MYTTALTFNDKPNSIITGIPINQQTNHSFVKERKSENKNFII